MSEREYPVPDFPGYVVLESGVIKSYLRYPDGKELTDQSHQEQWDKQGRRRSARRALANEFGKKTFGIHRVILAAKLGRWPEPWEEVRHKDGNWRNNAMSNLLVGDHLNNIIDDLEIGKRETSLDYLDEAIARLMDLRAEMEQEKSPSD